MFFNLPLHESEHLDRNISHLNAVSHMMSPPNFPALFGLDFLSMCDAQKMVSWGPKDGKLNYYAGKIPYDAFEKHLGLRACTCCSCEENAGNCMCMRLFACSSARSRWTCSNEQVPAAPTVGAQVIF